MPKTKNKTNLIFDFINRVKDHDINYLDHDGCLNIWKMDNQSNYYPLIDSHEFHESTWEPIKVHKQGIDTIIECPVSHNTKMLFDFAVAGVQLLELVEQISTKEKISIHDLIEKYMEGD